MACQVCGDTVSGPRGEGPGSSQCAECGHVYHDTCLPLSLRTHAGDQVRSRKIFFTINNKYFQWRCGTCRKCGGCGGSVVTGSSSSKEVLCPGCSRARAQGSYCPLCRGCYSDGDYDTAMMECSKCGG